MYCAWEIEPLALSMSSSLASTAALAGTLMASNKPPHRAAAVFVEARRIAISEDERDGLTILGTTDNRGRKTVSGLEPGALKTGASIAMVYDRAVAQ